jgi:hypothetical protein
MAGITGGSGTSNKANVDTGFNLQVALPNTDALTGSIRLKTENDAGDITGFPTLGQPETSPDFRLRTGIDTVLFSDSFNGTAQNTEKWNYTFATLTAVEPGAGTVNFSAVQGTTSAHGAFMRTSQYFPVVSTSPLAIDFTGAPYTAALAANENWLAGLGVPAAVNAAPTDGCWWKFTTAGLEGILKYNGTETSTGIIYPFASVTLGVQGKWLMVVGERTVQWWADDTLLQTQDIPAGQATPFMSTSLPVFMHKFNTGNVANTNTMRVSRIGVTLYDVAIGKPAAQIAATQCANSVSIQNGTTVSGNTGINVLNAAYPTTAAIANATAGATFLGLGGLFVATAQAGTAALAGDMIACSYLNPIPTANISGRNLIITGVYLSCMNTGAIVAGTLTSLVWSVAYGHSALSLATVESASFATGTTRAPRRKMLGMMEAPIGAAIGALYSRQIEREFSTPLVVHPGEYIQAVVRFRIGTATALQEITYVVDFTGYWD